MEIKHESYIKNSTHTDFSKQLTHCVSPFSFKLLPAQPPLYNAIITLHSSIVTHCYTRAAEDQRKIIAVIGFEKGHVPVEYIKQHYQETLVSHLQEMLLKLYIINFFYQQIHEQQLIIAGDPRLIEASIVPGSDASFTFEINLITEYHIQEWRHFPFRPPKRKRYKDLDKQVIHFIESENHASLSIMHTIEHDDWVLFSLCFVDECSPEPSSEKQFFWLHIGKEETEGELRSLFIGKKVGDSYNTDNKALQEYFSSHLETSYSFQITIENKIAAQAVDFELLKKHFKIKTNKALHQKLIEVFSYRNDISLHRSMAQEALKALLNRYHIVPPTAMILRAQEELLESVKHNPDYNVYRTEKEFDIYLTQLAEKQCQEEILVDLIAAQEEITVTNDDVSYYLNIFKRQRTRELLYFRIPSFAVQNQFIPAPAHEMMHYCLREKTLNHIIYHLTKD